MPSRLLSVCFLCLTLLLSSPAAQSSIEPRLPAPAETPSPNEALIQRARSLSASGNHRESAEAWQAVASREPVISNFAQREAIRSLIAAGDLQQAFNTLTQLGSSAPAELLLSAAVASRSAGLLDRAAAFYRHARNTAGRTQLADEAAIGLAATLELDGRPREALETLRELQLTFRQSSAYDIAEAGARRLSSRLGGVEPLTEQDYESIADRLANVAAFRRAVDVLSEWRTNFPESLRRAGIDATIVQNLYQLRANDEARSRGEAFLKEYPGSALAHSVYITLFRLDVREGRTADVEKRGLALLSSQIEGTTLSDRQGAARLLAEYLVSIGQAPRSLGVYDQLYRLTTSRRDRLDVLWRMGIASLRAGVRARAIKEFQQVLRLRPDSETERAVTYWLAYAHDAAGSRTPAKTLWAALVKRYPFSYYGVKAAEQLGTSLPAPSLTFPDLALSEAVTAHPDFQAASLLARAGLQSDAAAYTRQLNGAFRRDEAVALLAARASEAAGDYTSASTLMSAYFGPYLERPASNLPADFWSLAYPRAYWPEVSTAAARHGVDPLLMLALARQESHFEPTARSPVGAMGLFQIMPYTAAELDPAFASPQALERLVEPEVSAELAASLLARLQTQYQRAPAPTIASYNADRQRVQIWWDAARGLPEELFIDSIPYRETRSYVRQVLMNYSMYQRFDVPRQAQYAPSPSRGAQSALPQK